MRSGLALDAEDLYLDISPAPILSEVVGEMPPVGLDHPFLFCPHLLQVGELDALHTVHFRVEPRHHKVNVGAAQRPACPVEGGAEQGSPATLVQRRGSRLPLPEGEEAELKDPVGGLFRNPFTIRQCIVSFLQNIYHTRANLSSPHPDK